MGSLPRSQRDLSNVYAYLVSPSSAFFRGDKPPADQDPTAYYQLDDEYFAFQNRILALEARILYALSFDTHVSLPHPLGVTYLQTLDFLGQPKGSIGKRTIEYLNTALLSPQMLYLTHQPNALATAAIYNAAKDVEAKMPECEWWEVFDVDREELGFLVVGMRSLEGWVKQQQEALPLIMGEGMVTRKRIDEEMRSDALLDECKAVVADILTESRSNSSETESSAVSTAEKGLLALPDEILSTIERLSAEVLTLRSFIPPDKPDSAADAGELLKQLDDELQRTYKKFYDFVYQDLPPVQQFQQMSMQKFQQYMDDGTANSPNGPLPFVVKGLMNDWPAMTTRPWRKPAYLLSRTFGGRRLVPVEVGRTYVDEGWGQELITFGELLGRLEDFEAPPGPQTQVDPEVETSDSLDTKPLSYLAQHELFTQLPILRNDIPTPDLCYTSPPPHPLSPSLNKPETPLPLINAWLGPAGTITPLHTDAYHNLLAQVVGAKYVRLYSPHDTEALCPRGEDDQGIAMQNTSMYDVGVIEGWDDLPEGEEARDDIELEEFRGLKYWECILEEGDMLYVPIGWWHYVRSLSVSFSVSFWWNGDHYVEDDEVQIEK
ncbi:hypothetical protein ACHAQH_003787 [Verticillium albo-atrum]